MNKIQQASYQLQDYWYLGFLGFIGFYELPIVFAYFQGDGSIWNLTSLLWFLWLLNFLPEKK